MELKPLDNAPYHAIPFALSSTMEAQLELYLNHLLAYNTHTNLTAHRDLEIIREKGVLDSLLFPSLKERIKGTWIDVGSGAGFPGVPLAIVFPQSQWTLLEPIQKKARFLSSLTPQIENIKVVSERAELWIQHHRESVDGVVSRAVASLNILVELCLPFVKVGGVFLAYKGMHAQEEIDLAHHAIETLGGVLESREEMTLPSTGEKRSLVVIRKVKPTPKTFPRLFSQIKHSPL